MALATDAIFDAIAPPPPRPRSRGDDANKDSGFQDALARTAPQHETPAAAAAHKGEAEPEQAQAPAKNEDQPGGENEQAPASADASHPPASGQPHIVLQLIVAQTQAETTAPAAPTDATQAAPPQPNANAAQAQSPQQPAPTKTVRHGRNGKEGATAHAAAPKTDAVPAPAATQTQAQTATSGSDTATAQVQAPDAPPAPDAPDVTPLLGQPNSSPPPSAQAQKSTVEKTAAIDANAPAPMRDAKQRAATAQKPEAAALAPDGRASAAPAQDSRTGDSKSASRPAAAPPPAQGASPASANTTPSQAPPAPNPPEVQRASPDLAQQAAARAAPIAAQVGHEIVRRFNGESTRFEMRLDPPELGRIDVKLDVTRDHRVTAIVSADNPQALSDLSRATRDLQQALQSAGLELADNGLSFDLSDRRGEAFANADRQSGASLPDNKMAAADEPPIPARPVQLESWRGARIDLMA
ncbi:MAG TPA: flagellar hook-length control protein FliK [Caulobacterales bacterium]|nr:flagellar hook-length control protein FliK [Caulobacterales bacterium]